MANTLRFKRGLVSGIPTAALGEPLFTTDTFDLYIGNGTGNTRFQKYIASGATTQILRGDGSLYTFPLAISSPSAGQVLKYNGTSWVNDSDAGITGSGSAGQVAYFTGATTQSGSNNLFWDSANGRLGIGTNSPLYRFHTISSDGTIGAFRNSGAALGQLLVGNTAGDLQVRILASGDGYILADTGKYLAFGSNGLERARIFSGGNVAIGSTSDNGLRFQVTGDGYFSGSVGIGSTSLTGYSLRVAKNVTGAANTIGVYNDGTIQSDSSSSYAGFYNVLRTQAASFNINFAYHFLAVQNTLGAGSTIANQYGFVADSSLTSATNNYGFYGNIASGTGRWNLYMNGTADNYLAGSLGIGITTPQSKLVVLNSSGTAIPSLGSHGGHLQLQNGTFGLLSGVTTGGSAWMQVQRTDGTATAYNLILQPTAGSVVIGSASSSSIPLYLNNASGNNTNLAFQQNSTDKWYIRNITGTDDFSFYSVVGAAERMRLTSGGNLGLGGTPSAWGTNERAFQLRGGGTAYNPSIAYIGGEFELIHNAFYNGTNYVYTGTGYGSTRLRLGIQGAFQFFTTGNVSGTAGATPSYTQAMTLDASGNLAVGTTNTDIFSRGDARNVVISATGASDNMSLQLNAGASGGRGSQIYMGAGGVRYFTIGTNVNETQIGTVTSTPIIFYTNNGEKMRLFADGNLGIGTGNSNAGFKLDVNGTMRVSGNATVSLNQNAVTKATISNTTSGTGSRAELEINSSNGTLVIGKYSATTSTYKTFVANDGTIYNGVNGNLSILNDVSGGSIILTAGASQTAHFTIASTGAATFSSSVTAGGDLAGNSNLILGTLGGADTTIRINGHNTAYSIIDSNAGYNSAYNGLMIRSNANNGNSGADWQLDLGGRDITFGQDHFVISRLASGGSNTQFLRINNTGAATFSSSVTATSALISNYRLELPNMNIGYWDSTNNRFESTTRPMFFTSYGSGNNIYFGFDGSYGAMTLHRATSNTHIGGTTDTGEKLQVTGTMRVSGASTFNNFITVTRNQDANVTTFNATAGVTPVSAFVINTDQPNLRAVLTSRNGYSLALGTNDTNRLTIDTTGAATFSSSVTANSFNASNATANITLLNGTADQQQIRLRMSGTNGVLDVTRNSGAVPNLIFGTEGAERMRLDGNGNLGIANTTPSYKLDVTGEARVSNALAIGTTPDTNKPFKILKNINGTVGINFENTSTGSSAFSAIQMGTDVTGGTAFTNLVYSSSGVTAAGVYQPSGTSLINTGSGGLNFLSVSQPIRFFTSTGNGTERLRITNDGDITHYNGTSPSASTTDAYRMYSADVVAGNAAPHFRTENGAIIKLYQETTSVGNSIMSLGGGTPVLDDTTFDGYTLKQIVKALRNQGILA